MSEASPVRSLMTAQEYYSSFSRHPRIKERFHDIDDPAHFREHLALLRDVQTQNFVLDFGNEDAWCAVNLEQQDVTALLTYDVCGPQKKAQVILAQELTII
jgi:hypothetical protein